MLHRMAKLFGFGVALVVLIGIGATQIGKPGGLANASVSASPPTIYVGSNDDHLYALNPDGTLQWKFWTGNWVISSPAIGADGTVYVGSDDYNLYALNPDGTLRWKFWTGSWVGSSPAIGADGTIYVGSGDDHLYALNPDGTLRWKFKTGSDVDSSPAIGGAWPMFHHDLRHSGRVGGP